MCEYMYIYVCMEYMRGVSPQQASRDAGSSGTIIRCECDGRRRLVTSSGVNARGAPGRGGVG